MGTNVTIRPVTTADLPAIYEFVCDLENQRFNQEQFATFFETCLAAPNHHYLIAEVNNMPVGYTSCHGQVLLHHCGMVYEIQELFVLEEYRSKGVGKQLLAALENLIGTEEYKLLEVSSNMRCAYAHRFYLANGFERTSYKFCRNSAP